MRRLALVVVAISAAACGCPRSEPVGIGWTEIHVGQTFQQVVDQVGEPCIILGDWPEPRGRGPFWKYGCEVDGGWAHSVRLADGYHVSQVDGAP
jgi:hypothetical protein